MGENVPRMETGEEDGFEQKEAKDAKGTGERVG